MVFPPYALTAAGQVLLAKVLDGSNISFSRISVGDGSFPNFPNTIPTDLVNYVMDMLITNTQRTDSTFKIFTSLTSGSVAAPFFLREMGVYAMDPDVGEVMVIYSNNGANAQMIDPSVPLTTQYALNMQSWNAPNVTVVIDNLGFLTQDDAANFATRDFVLSQLQNRPSFDNVYTISQIDDLLSQKENSLTSASSKLTLTDNDEFIIRDSKDNRSTKAISFSDVFGRVIDGLGPVLGLDLPTNFTITPGDSQLEVTANHAPNPATTFTRLVWKTGSAVEGPTDGTYIDISGNPGDAWDYTITGLENGTMYFLALFADEDNSTFSAGVPNSATPMVSVGIVTNFTASAGYRQAMLSWDNPGPPWVNTTIIMKEGSYPSSIPDGTVVVNASTATSFTVTDLTPGTTYYFRAFPSNGVSFNTSTTGQQVSATPFDVDPVFGNNSWNTIFAVSQIIVANNMTQGQVYATFGWSPGDIKTHIISGQTVTAVIMGFNHDNKTGGGKQGVSLLNKELLSNTAAMNATNTNAGGWDAAALRATLNNTIFGQLEAGLQAVISATDKLTANNGSQAGAAIVTSSDKLWLASEMEVFGNNAGSRAGEGAQYAYWAANNNNTARIKYIGSTATYWWLRSPDSSTASYFRGVGTNGAAATNYSASSAYGVAVGFCI